MEKELNGMHTHRDMKVGLDSPIVHGMDLNCLDIQVVHHTQLHINSIR